MLREALDRKDAARFRQLQLGMKSGRSRDGQGRYQPRGADQPRAHRRPRGNGQGGRGYAAALPYEVRTEQYFDEIQDVKVTKDMLDLAKHIVNQKAGPLEPETFEDHYDTALIDLINKKRAGKPITAKERPASTNVVDLMEALRRSVGDEAAPAKAAKPTKKPRKAAAGQNETLMPIEGKKAAKEATAKKPAKPQRKSA
jgi:hypothetical protein